ncbi:unnamed protein product [Adineta steineri]|uniref:Uncharacterized protein n=2 Tax=Adineta steineri TaxID=433720 RepID=A0A814XEW0_9BILA|nr:unnamed protein product [Adineta steineri]CAF3799315.1 unnamed protein product [Adineta steineri]
MEELNESTFTTFDQNPSELIQATLNTNALSADICDGLCDIFDIQSYFPIVSNFNSDHTNININDIADRIVYDYQQSTTLGPIRSISDFNGIQVPNREQVNYHQTNQLLSTKADVFYIISQPNNTFRPRTEKERVTAHYLRCPKGDKYEYLTTTILQTWRGQKSYIEVSLLDIYNNPHLYRIENRECKKSSVVFKPKESNKLCFHITDDDIAKGFKRCYLIEFVKCKQDDQITKEVIKERQLNKSKLRFTRYYQTTDGSYERDESSIIDSIVMTEEYGKFRVEDVFPLDGPMQSKRKICIETKGPLPNDFKTNLVVNIIGNDINWSRKGDEIKKNGNNFSFEMPVLPNVHMNRLEAKINIEYKQNQIYQANYLYISSLDRELSVKTSNRPDECVAVNILSSDASSTSSFMASNSDNRGQKRKRR